MWKNSLNRHVTQNFKIWKVDGTDGSFPVGILVRKAYDALILVEKDDGLKYSKLVFYKKGSVYLSSKYISWTYYDEFRVKRIHCMKKPLLNGLVTGGMVKSEMLISKLVWFEKLHG